MAPKNLPLIIGLVLGFCLSMAVVSHWSCASLPTTDQAKAGLDTAQQVHDALDLEVKRQVAVAATQPANPQMAKELAATQKALDQSQKGLQAAQALNDLVQSNDPTKAIGLLSPALATVPYGWLALTGISLGAALLKGVKASQLQTALTQTNQAIHATLPNATVATLMASLDSTTRALAAPGVIHVADDPAPVAVTAPAAGTYPVQLKAPTP